MTRLDVTALVLLAVGSAPPLVAADFVVVAATGVLEPAGLKAGQELSENTRVRLEPWGRALIRETTGCRLTHVVVGLGDYLLTPAQDCAAIGEPANVVVRLQKGETFAERLEEAGSGPADELVSALVNEPCVFLERVSEEGGGKRQCPSGFALRGLRCSGPHCDDKDLLCCPYLGGAADPDASAINSRWISEETFPNAVQSKKFLDGLTCRGAYCDDLLAGQFKSPRLVNTRKCDWIAWSSERPGTWLDCQLGRFAAGLRCREDFCGEVGLYCCEARVE